MVIPPTRGIRYKDLPNLLVPKNSFRIVQMPKKSKLFNIQWDMSLRSYKIQETTKTNIFKEII